MCFLEKYLKTRLFQLQRFAKRIDTQFSAALDFLFPEIAVKIIMLIPASNIPASKTLKLKQACFQVFFLKTTFEIFS